MKIKNYLISLLLVISFIHLTGQSHHGIVTEIEQMDSKILKKAVRYAVYLPPGYSTSLRSYPVVYLLHGYTGNETDWIQFGRLDQIIDEAILEGTLPPMVIVMPDGENNWYINSYDGEIMYEDMFVQEFIPFAEKKFRIRSSKEFRGIAGLSMGGHGSLIFALRHPDLFAASAPLSAGIVPDKSYVELPQDRYDEMFGFLFGRDMTGEERLNDHYKMYAPLHIVANQAADSTARVKFYIDCGDDDWLTMGNSELHILMTEMEIPHEYRVRDGAHDWEYWRTGLVDALLFISKSFTR